VKQPFKGALVWVNNTLRCAVASALGMEMV
jgi:hypothetical protein